MSLVDIIIFFYFFLLTLGQNESLTISEEHEDGQIHSSFPAWVFLDGDAVARGGKHFAAPDGDQLAALVPARHVIQHRRVVDEGIQFAVQGDRGVAENLQVWPQMFCCCDWKANWIVS